MAPYYLHRLVRYELGFAFGYPQSFGPKSKQTIVHASIISLRQSPNCTVRDLLSFVGQIISLSPVVGNITRLMTRNCQTLIAQTNNEDQIITPNAQCFKEINVWHVNARRLNNRSICLSPKVNKIRTDAIMCNDNHVAHKNLTPEDRTVTH